jgi:hypothetical protein
MREAQSGGYARPTLVVKTKVLGVRVLIGDPTRDARVGVSLDASGAWRLYARL